MSEVGDVVQNNTNATDTTQAPQASGNEAQVPPVESASEQQVQPPSEVKEIKYDVKLPDGSLLDAKQVEEVVAFAKANNLSNEQAQDLLNRENETVSAYQKTQESTFEETKAGWVDAVMNDKELGGQGFNQSVEFAHRALEKFGSVELKETLDKTGLGNHPELVRVFSRIGKAMADDTLVSANASNASTKKSMEEVFYGAKN
jgi:hypothetical protein